MDDRSERFFFLLVWVPPTTGQTDDWERSSTSLGRCHQRACGPVGHTRDLTRHAATPPSSLLLDRMQTSSAVSSSSQRSVPNRDIHLCPRFTSPAPHTYNARPAPHSLISSYPLHSYLASLPKNAHARSHRCGYCLATPKKITEQKTCAQRGGVCDRQPGKFCFFFC